jgi:ABC-type transport system involved in cytochrome bd biosynthesis fused ATPase/permease subunit
MGPLKLSLMIVGLLSCPNEFDNTWTPSSAADGLPRPDEAFVATLEKLLQGASEPFETGRINTRLCWRDNLLFGAPTSSNSRLQSEIDTIILDGIAGHQLSSMLLACGFSYRVGRQGKKLSGGQRQRVCLGRTLLQDVLVYILDEPSSALDPQARRLINDYLKERSSSSTIIAITHDRDLAQAADQVLMVHEGRLHASGTFNELMKENEEFRRVVGGM